MRQTNLIPAFLLAAILLMAGNLLATDYVVSGAGSNEVNGTYVENGTNSGKPQYRLGSTDYYLRFDNFRSRWEIGEDGFMFNTYYYTDDAGNTPPSTGWTTERGAPPVPTVEEVGPNLSWSTDGFYESTDNDGSMGNTITITYSLPQGDSFSGSNGMFSTDNYTTANVPAGLSISITKNSDTELSVALTGNASSHAYTDDIANLGITFLDAAFTNGDASAVNNTAQSNIMIDYGLPITSLADLRTLSETDTNWDEYIIQTTDIDASATSGWNVGDHDGDGGTTPEEAMGFYPIGRENGTTFTGHYNGGGYSITNLYINRVDTDISTDAGRYIGLFGYSKGKIENLGVSNANITGFYCTGALVGVNLSEGSVRNCYSSGNVNSNSKVGGLIGSNWANVHNSYSTADVLCTYEDTQTISVGGFVGYAVGSSHISNCYSTGDVTKEKAGDFETYGAFCGQNQATIENCYTTGSVTYNQGDNPSDKGFVGDLSSGGTYGNNFFDSDASNQTSATGATGKTTAEMKDYTTFTNAGWDFKGESTNGSDDIWNIGNARNDGYPYLDWQYPADPATLPVTLSSFTAMFANNSPVLQWETQSEDNNQGWNIYRSQDDLENATQINVELIPGAGTTSQITLYSYNDELDFAAQTEYFYWLESVDSFGQTELYGPVSLVIPEDQEDPETPDIPINYGLSNHPNPFNPATTINFAVRETGVCQIVVYDCKGRKIRTLFNETAQANTNYSLLWNGCDDNGNQVSSGVYFYKLRSADKNYTRKMLLLK